MYLKAKQSAEDYELDYMHYNSTKGVDRLKNEGISHLIIMKYHNTSDFSNKLPLFEALHSITAAGDISNGFKIYDPQDREELSKSDCEIKNKGLSSKVLTYGEEIICNKIESLQRALKTLLVAVHEKGKIDDVKSELSFTEDTDELLLYSFNLAELHSQKNPKKSSLKILASHGVIGSFFGSNGHRIQALQQEHSVNVSVTTKRVHFPGSNNKGVLLIHGRLPNVLKVLRPLYKAMQEEIIRLFIDDTVKIKAHNVRLEIEVLITESLRFVMDRNKYFKQIMQISGANMRVIKQTFEDGPVQERVLVIFGKQKEVEIALEKVAIMIQDDLNFRFYSYMNYPDLTVSTNVNDYTSQNRFIPGKKTFTDNVDGTSSSSKQTSYSKKRLPNHKIEFNDR
ncbi:hypothetical protein BEWA_009350 [Theileria equi strain WA]|uniref:K Homology domain-containing protein n=1 Tax=Theileria equi strain WA TaxID=1537102 RepID=L0B2S1_THEEQ|nr:hypothetical protein BEWA_009350 [Theileria equi strain WA]AFZ81521.1 hypothetical protein BEWA_009350 [Theileria equi strain WA]|eukprot:XP_004831187.1 hypothetical protein BEWA_009350 [Theileria equi strain WA]